ncbi:hypothetical protein [Pseudoxanthomonas sp.]|uniref:hypothetical protein n=1 Tax=Pseudoxanthomonas sp. TaxID=1871049 RepID=UPI00262834AC|nr:hypothetical protein [Pseudoxanthomonas sp.]WDS37783.1 MAG: hypothetical protein O8I58_07915 [Pseudoxanthomonas sp.]
MVDKDHSPIVPIDDGFTSFVADEARLRTFKDASEQLSRFQGLNNCRHTRQKQGYSDLPWMPRLADVAGPHEKLFVAAFDGNGNVGAVSALSRESGGVQPMFGMKSAFCGDTSARLTQDASPVTRCIARA